MPQDMAQTFIAALHRCEQQRELDSLVELFSDNAELTNINHAQPFQGREGVQRFWNEYRSIFKNITSEFKHIVQGERVIVLEWISAGTLATGKEFRYPGCSILEIENGKIVKFRAYYDASPLISHARAA